MRSQPVSEKQEQAAIVQLLESLSAKVYVIGTKRRKGDYQGTMQTPGIPDLYVFMPPRVSRRDGTFYTHQPNPVIWIEVKSSTGRLSRPQREFETLCQFASHRHLVGGLDTVQNWLVDHGWLKESQRRSA